MKYFLITLLIVVVVYILPLNVRPMAMPDETRYAEIPREMIASGDWVVPRLNGLRYFEKPALGYWLTGACLKLFGEHAFSVRLPSAVATGLSALALLLFVRKHANQPSIAFLAAVIFLTSVEVFALGTFAVLDAPLSLFITLIMIFFFSAFAEPASARQNTFLVLCGISCGAAFLIKGFLAFAIPIVSIIPFLLIEKRLKDIFRFVYIPLFTAMLVIFPWAILINSKEPDFWRYFFVVEHFQRFFAPGSHQQHPKPLWFFIPVMLVGFIPWTFILPAAIKGLRKKSENTVFLRFILCWIVFPFILLSLSKGKLATYILPLYPPIAIATSLGLVSCLNHNTVPALKRGAFISVLFGIVLLGLLIFGQKVGFKAQTIFTAGEEYKLSLFLGAAISWTIIAGIYTVTSHKFAGFLIYATAPIVMFIIIPFAIPDLILHNKRYLPEPLIQRNMSRIPSDSHIFADPDDTPAICWSLKRSDVTIIGGGGELVYGLKYEDSKHRLVSLNAFQERIRSGNAGKYILIEETADIDKFLKYSPTPLFKDIEDAFLLIQF